MHKLSRTDLLSLEKYTATRNEFRARVMRHKQDRRLAIGPNANLYFEDRLTIQYQIQEMLRIEKIFDAHGIEEELDAYNPLIPDGSNWKATFMLEFEDADERKQRLSELIDIESRVWMQVAGFDRVAPFYDEDLERSTDEKTSSVHFMRFELAAAMIKTLKKGVSLSAGIEHPHYKHILKTVPENIHESLLNDLD